MGTITKRKRADGTQSYTAQIRLKHGGKLVHNETQTFSRLVLATDWMRRREHELESVRATGIPLARNGITVGKLIDDYVSAADGVESWGRTKSAELNRLRRGVLTDIPAERLTVQDIMDYTSQRRKDGAAAPTALGDLTWMRQVFLRAAAVLGMSGPLEALDRARAELLRTRVVGKGILRTRRLEKEEEDALMAYFARRDERSEIRMGDVVQFALLTARRQEEICRLRWDDVDPAKGIAWMDDVKHPRMKKGNRRCFRVLAGAAAIIERQPSKGTSEFVFPFNSRTVGALFARACKMLGIVDLRFHDLRHEAASRLFERGYAIQEVAQFTLHESWATLKRYTHLKPENVPER